MAATDPQEVLRHAMAYEHRLFLETRKHEQLAARWQDRADLAQRRGEQGLASEARQRQATESGIAQEYQAQYVAQTQAIRRAKQGLRRSARLPAVAQSDPVDARLEQLAREDRLERDLAALKARLSRGGKALT